MNGGVPFSMRTASRSMTAASSSSPADEHVVLGGTEGKTRSSATRASTRFGATAVTTI